MHMFSFIPDRLLLSRKCYELINYARGSCLLSPALYYFSLTAPMVPMLVHVERRYSQLPICALLCGVCLLTNGLQERSNESPVRASQHCAAAANLRRYRDREWEKKTEEEREVREWRCSQNITLKHSLKSLNMHRFSTCNRHLINFVSKHPSTRCWRSRCVWKGFAKNWLKFQHATRSSTIREKYTECSVTITTHGVLHSGLSVSYLYNTCIFLGVKQCAIEKPSTSAWFTVLLADYLGQNCWVRL